MFWIVIESFLFIITISVCKCHTLYFNSYIDEFHIDDIITNKQKNDILIDNEHIKIELVANISTFIINDKVKLNWNDDKEWDTISNIYYDPFIINSIPINDNNNNNNTERRLIDYDYTSWNKYDHTTEHHIISGRFIGESKYKRKFRDAEAMCHEFYADLASIRNQFENAKVQQLCKKLGSKGSCWIGLQMDKKNNNWDATKNWLDGHPIGYKNWAPGEPNNVRGREKCAEIYRSTGKWNDVPCNRKRYAICEKVESHHMGRFIGVYKLASWYKGNLYCKMKYGTELATITSEWKQQDALTACNSVKNEFMKENCWMGLKKQHNILWEWVDNSLMQYKNWGEQEPKSNPSKKCAYINAHTQSGVWANDFCNAQKWIICNAEESTPTLMTKDMLFPPTYKEIHARNSMMKYLEHAEEQQKKNEEALVKLEQHKTQSKHTISEDNSELKSETREENKNKPQPPPFSQLPLGQLSKPQQPQTKLQIPSHGEDKEELRDETKEERPYGQLQPQIPPQMQPQTRPQSPNYVPPLPQAPNTGNVDQKISQVHQRLDQIEKKLDSLHGNSLHIDNNNNDEPMGMLNNLVHGLMGQSGQGNVNNMVKQNAFDHSFNTQGYNPGKDPYFGDYNMKYAHHQRLKQHLQALHAANQDNHDPYSPPSGNADDPYGFNGGSQYNPQFYPQTQIPGPHAGSRRLYYDDNDEDVIISKATTRCKYIDNHNILCIKYDYQRNEIMLESDIAVANGKYDTKSDNVQYYEEMDLMFEFNPYRESHKLCKIVNGINICLMRDLQRKSTTMFVDDNMINEWDEIYSNINKKCINLPLNKLCFMSIVDFSDYLVSIQMKE